VQKKSVRSQRGSGAFVILGYDEDLVPTLMKPKKHEPSGYQKTFHVGFYVDNAVAVHTNHDELTVAGLSPGEIRDVDHNNMRETHFYCTAPGDVVVEIATPPNL